MAENDIGSCSLVLKDVVQARFDHVWLLSIYDIYDI